jgi:hypothetical protein
MKECARREALAVKADKLFAELAPIYSELVEIGNRLCRTGILKDADSCITYEAILKGEWRVGLVKAGCNWETGNWPWPMETRASFSARIKRANAFVDSELTGKQPPV